jgi:fructose-bisphosphate aldolase class II
MLVSPAKLFARARRKGYALPAFNTMNLEITQAIVRGLERVRAPGIIAVSPRTAAYAGMGILRDIICELAQSASVPLCLHLDHGKDFAIVEEAIAAGFSSVMIDGSALPFAENVRLTKRVVLYAHARRVWVEGEIGPIPGRKERQQITSREKARALLTKPEEAEEFVRATGVDSLAVAVGTWHGVFAGKEFVDLPRLRAIARRVKVPLVLHGGSGLSLRQLRAAVKHGVRKVNIDTDLRLAFRLALDRAASKHDEIDPRQLLGQTREAIAAVVMRKAKQLGAAGQG